MVRLLDVNVLIALAYPPHVAHQKMSHWYDTEGVKAWASCPLTQTGFIRIVSNPAFSATSPDVSEAVALLASLIQSSRHQFWPDELPMTAAADMFGAKLVGHQQVTDAYLLALAISKRGQLVTLARSLKTLAGPQHAGQVLVL